MAVSKLVSEVLSAPLLAEGFKKKADSWYWANDKVVLVVNLQKSQYGDQYYVNCAVALKALGVVEFPKENHCHIRFRLTAVVPDDERKHAESVFNLEDKSLPEKNRQNEISRLVREHALRILKMCTSIGGIAQVVKSGQLANVMIHKLVKDLIL